MDILVGTDRYLEVGADQHEGEIFFRGYGYSFPIHTPWSLNHLIFSLFFELAEGIVIEDSKGRGLNWFALIFLKHVWKELNGLIGSVKV